MSRLVRAAWLDDFVLAPFVFDGLQAKLAAAAGAKAVYMTGFGTAAQHGVPDLGLIGRAEMAANAERTVEAAETCMERCGHLPLLLNSFVNASVAEALGYRLMLGLRVMGEIHDAIAAIMSDFMATGGSADDPIPPFEALTRTVGLAEADAQRAAWSDRADAR